MTNYSSPTILQEIANYTVPDDSQLATTDYKDYINITTTYSRPTPILTNSRIITSGPISTTVSTASTTTDYINFNDNQQIYCQPFNSTGLIANTTSTADGVAVKVSCSPGYQVLALQNGDSNVFQCSQGIWLPSTPRCTLASSSQIPIGIIVGCTIGAIVCLLIIIFAFYMMHRNNNDNKRRTDNEKLKEAKMKHMDYFMTAFQEQPEADITELPSWSPQVVGSSETGLKAPVDNTSLHQSHSMSSLTEVEVHKDSDSTSSIGDSASMFERNLANEK